jgi:hypothetical protein
MDGTRERKFLNVIEVIALLLLVAAALFFLGIALYGFNAPHQQQALYLFGFVDQFPAALALLICFGFLGIALIGLVIKTKKPIALLWELVLVPALCFAALTRFFDSSDSYERDVKDFDSTFVIASDSFLLAGWSKLYQKTSAFSLRYLASVAGDDGYQPLADERFYTLSIEPKGVVFTYDYGDGSGVDGELCLRYDEGLWQKVGDRSELLGE